MEIVDVTVVDESFVLVVLVVLVTVVDDSIAKKSNYFKLNNFLNKKCSES